MKITVISRTISILSSVGNIGQLLLSVLLLFLFEEVTAHEIITRVSANAEGIGGNGASVSPTISADGRYIAFQSDADNLVPEDNNGFTDIFVYDRQTEQMTRVSVSSSGTEGDFVSFFPAISSNGRYVAFQSNASNLVEKDRNRTTDIFVHDRETGWTNLVSINNEGEYGNSSSSEPVISGDGRYVAFHSNATNLAPNDTNKSLDVFVYDRDTEEISPISISHLGKFVKGASIGPAISANGRYVAFSSHAQKLVKDDQNDSMDVFIRDQETNEIMLVSVASDGQPGNGPSFAPTLSAEGRYVAFRSTATNLVTNDTNEVEDIFVHDRETSETMLASVSSTGQQANGISFGPRLSADGRYVAFNSNASNLVADDDNDSTDVFIHDIQTKQTHRLTLISQSSSQMLTSSYAPAISGDGRWVAFESKAFNLVVNDLNKVADIFVYDRGYYASYNIATRELYIPVLNVPEIGLFRASLHLLPGNLIYQFILDRSSSFRIPLEDGISSSYALETGILHLPRLEVFDTPKEIRKFEVEMAFDPQLSIFTVTKLIRIP